MHFFTAIHQAKTHAKLLVQRVRIIPNNLQTAALGRAFRSESADYHTSSGLYGTGHLTDIGNTVALRGKEMKDGAIMPHIVGSWFQVDFRDIGNKPMDTLRGFA